MFPTSRSDEASLTFGKNIEKIPGFSIQDGLKNKETLITKMLFHGYWKDLPHLPEINLCWTIKKDDAQLKLFIHQQLTESTRQNCFRSDKTIPTIRFEL